jgi:hypothetical protein
MKPIFDSTITCPYCGAQTTERMPVDSCRILYACPACHAILKPRDGDCCVFCSYGSVPCPPVQAHRYPPGTTTASP